MTPETINQYFSEGYNLVPVTREILADLDTPVSSYLKLAQDPFTFLFESVEGGEKWGRYSIIGLPSNEILKVTKHQVEIIKAGEMVHSSQESDPLAFVERYRHQFKVPVIEGLPRFHGGLVGYFAYDTVRYVEPKLSDSLPEDHIGTPDILLMLAKDVLVFDNLSGKIQLITHVESASEDALREANLKLLALEQALRSRVVNHQGVELSDDASIEDEVKLHYAEKDFEAAVEAVKEYVLAGDVMQVVLSQRMSIAFDKSPVDLYRALRLLNPSPYMYCMNLGDHHVVGSSPEILVRSEDQLVTVRPIAGTRKRGKNEAEDKRLEKNLLDDPKEIAEHLMLIDLGRNDVGKIAKTGSVKLTEKMIVERYSHVMHITSNVTGHLEDGLSCIDALKATMPAGTLSGAPKVRAMEIIDELESEKRGIYGGAIGYIGWNGDMDTAIAIRTGVIKDKRLYVQAGAGVVADSEPSLEWMETRNKARAVLRAASMVRDPKERQS